MIQFTLEHQYQLYLQRVKLKEENMSAIQRQEMKRCFIGACGQMLLLLRDDLADLDEEVGVVILENMINEVGNFFLTEQNKQN